MKLLLEKQKERNFDVLFENGLPVMKIQSDEEIISWDVEPLKIILDNNCDIGQDCLKLFLELVKRQTFT